MGRLERIREWSDRLNPRGLDSATYEQRLIAELAGEVLPRHVAVLADGTRRWARLNAPGETLVAGYRAGAAKLQEFVGWCDEGGAQVSTLGGLSPGKRTQAPDHAVPPPPAGIGRPTR